jgi:hypothetical protein
VYPMKLEAIMAELHSFMVSNEIRGYYVQELHSFMVLVGYYRHFVEPFSKIANPITKLQKKINKLVWS